MKEDEKKKKKKEEKEEEKDKRRSGGEAAQVVQVAGGQPQCSAVDRLLCTPSSQSSHPAAYPGA